MRKLSLSFVLSLQVLLLTLSLVSCSSTATTHPGAANSFDSQAYDTLLTVQAAIDQAKIQFKDNPQAQPALDKVRASYNAAMDAYLVYHNAAISGTSQDTTALAAQINQLVADVAALGKTFK